MKYIKLFSTSAEYEAFITGDQFVTPNISFIPTERLAKYSSVPKPKAEPKVTLEYDCPEDNLLAFTSGVGNVKKLTVDSKNIEFEPLQNIQGTKEILASEIVFDTETKSYQIPNDYIFPQLPSSIKMKPMDPSYEITNNTGFFMFAHIPAYNMTVPAGTLLISEGVEMGYLTLNDDNSVSLGEAFMAEMKPMFDAYGYQLGFSLCENVYSDNPTIINTNIEFKGVVGGLQTPYYFDTPGRHTVEMVLTDGNFGGFYMFINSMEEQFAALTSITLNEAITYIYAETFVSRSLTHITCEGKTAPILRNKDGDSGIDVPYFGTLVYPKGSDYSSWLDINNGFGAYGWNQEPPVITCTYNVTDISAPTKICNELSDYNGNSFSNITVDGVLMTNQSTGVTFTTAQKHTVEFELNRLSIPNSAFSGCTSLTDVTIGSGVTEIGDYAFEGCSSLTSIVIPDSVTELGYSAFYNCSGLTIENNVVYADKWVVDVTNATLSSYIIKYGTIGIGYQAFEGCSNLSSINIPDSVKIISHFAFDGCSGLTGELVIPDSVTTIGHYAFDGCSGLTCELVIPDSVTTIEYDAFRDCSGLTELTIGSGLTEISGSAFEGCTSLSSIVVSPNNTKYDSRENCNCIITTATNELIAGCNNSFIPDGVTTISDYAFHYRIGLTEITIPNSVKTINSYAFEGCSSVSSINIPDSVTYIGNYPFRICSSLSSIVVSPDNTKYDSRENCNCIIETASNELIQGSNNSFIPDSVTSIDDYAFSRCYGLTSINIPDSVTELGYSAFYNCSGLTELTIGSGLTEIGDYAFDGCSSLSSIVVSPDNIKYNSRENCNCIIETTSNKLIKGCNNSFIPDGVTEISSSAFTSCIGLTSIIIPDSVTTIKYDAFKGCSGLTELTIGSGLTEFSNSAFSGCTSLSSITVSPNNTKYDSRENCNCIIETATNTLIKGFNNTVIPDSVTFIESGAFEYCSGLTELTIGSGVTNINGHVFNGCKGLTSITCLASTPPRINNYTFVNIKSNGTIYVPVGCADNYKFSSWTSTGMFYPGYYGWSIQEITPTAIENRLT